MVERVPGYGESVRAGRPSVTARIVALTRANFDRPTVPTGDAEAEARLYRSLGTMPFPGPSPRWHARMERRTKFFDVATLDALDAGVTQVVVLAAGYDGRPLRFATPGVRWFEVDHPATQPDKRARLTAIGAGTEHITFVPVDLVTGDLPGSLTRAGFDPAKASLFTVEGLLSYLPKVTTESLLDDLRSMACPDSRMAVAFPLVQKSARGFPYLRQRFRRLVFLAMGEPQLQRFGPDDVKRLLSQRGWTLSVKHGSPMWFQGDRGVLVVAQPTM
jgi:methyltransferase (TIGR00027 family)